MKNWRVKQVKMVDQAQEKIVRQVVYSIDLSLKKALDILWSTYEKTGALIMPSLNEVFVHSEEFYRDIVVSAYKCVEKTKSMQNPEKKLALGLPKGKALDKILKDKKYFKQIMKRSAKMSKKLRDAYLKKIRKQYEKIVPLLESGEISPREAKQEMLKAWQATKPRVETIFRTETTNYFAKSQTNFYKDDEDIIGFMFDSVRDTSRTEVCRSRHGIIYRPNTSLLEKNTPALHYNCRSHLIPLANTKENRKLLSDPQRDPAKRKVEPLPIGWRK